MPSSKLLFLFFLISCATTETKPVVAQKSSEDPEQFRIKCEEENNALACARYGYIKKDLFYTKQACYLGDKNACFNAEEIESRIPNQNFAMIASNQPQIYGCYVNHTIDEDNGQQAPEDKEVGLLFTIDTLGKISGLSIQGQMLSEKFKQCVVNSFSSKKFLSLPYDQSLRYEFAFRAIKKDRRMKNAPKTDF